MDIKICKKCKHFSCRPNEDRRMKWGPDLSVGCALVDKHDGYEIANIYPEPKELLVGVFDEDNDGYDDYGDEDSEFFERFEHIFHAEPDDCFQMGNARLEKVCANWKIYSETIEKRISKITTTFQVPEACPFILEHTVISNKEQTDHDTSP